MAIMKLASSVAEDMLEVLLAAIDAGAGAILEFYTGTMPENLGAITDQTKLATVTLSDPCATVSGATLTFGAITPDAASDATGTAAWARLLTEASGNAIADFDVTVSAGTGAIKMNTVDFVVGGPVGITAATITLG